jgi:hypothetical protein
VTVTENTRVGRLSQLEKASVMKLQAACNYINAEVTRTRNKVLIAFVGLALLAALGAWIMATRFEAEDPSIPFFVAFAIWSSYMYRQRRALNKIYKTIVVTRTVNALGQGLTYSPQASFSVNDFNNMGLFTKEAENWRAEDEICGRKNAVTYTILEARATRTEGSGKNRRTVRIFQGVIARLDFNKNFRTHTIIVPDNESWGLFSEAENRHQKTLARMDSVEFEKCFSVYCMDQQEARYLLTPKLMALLMRANAALGGKIRASFQDNHLYITIPSTQDRFNVGIFTSTIAPETIVGELAEVIGLAERLIDTLDLETRIWSRV